MGAGEMEDDRGMVIEDECEVGTQNLDGKLMLMLIREGILVDVMVVVAVRSDIFDLGGFCCGGGGNGGGGFRVGDRSCCEASLGLFQWEEILFVAFELNVS